jgi:uncharacterized integral membrane protein
MALLRILLILLLLGAGIFLVLQNQGLFVITLLGTKMPSLPLGVLLLLSILLGLSVGILLLFLLKRRTPAKASRRSSARKSNAKKSFRSPFKSNPFKSNSSQAKKSQSKSSHSTQHKTFDWYDAPAQDWTGPSPRGATNEYASRSPQGSYFDEDQDPYPNRSNTEFEDSPSAFRQSRKETPRERVVDADYRVLRQPNAPPPSDDDWDDEFFEDNR